MSEFRLPDLDLSTPATVSHWLKRPGDAVGAHEKLLEVFSVRFDWDISSPSAGVLTEIVAAEGAQVSSGAVLAMLDGATAEAEPPAPMAARIARVSPLAARIAADRHIDLEQARGSGPDGRVNKEDVLALLETRSEGANPETARAAVASADAQALTAPAESSNVRPHTVTTFVAVDMSHVDTQRNARRTHWHQREGFALDYLPYVVVATATALRAAPISPGMPDAEEGAKVSANHIEVVQAGGSTPLRNADALNLVGAARRLQAPPAGQSEPMAQPIVIEDHGSGGALLATGLLTPGAAGLLSVGTVHKQAVAIGEALQTRLMVYLGLTYDPHWVDEGKAGTFMAELKRLLEVVSFS